MLDDLWLHRAMSGIAKAPLCLFPQLKWLWRHQPILQTCGNHTFIISLLVVCCVIAIGFDWKRACFLLQSPQKSCIPKATVQQSQSTFDLGLVLLVPLLPERLDTLDFVLRSNHPCTCHCQAVAALHTMQHTAYQILRLADTWTLMENTILWSLFPPSLSQIFGTLILGDNVASSLSFCCTLYFRLLNVGTVATTDPESRSFCWLWSCLCLVFVMQLVLVSHWWCCLPFSLLFPISCLVLLLLVLVVVMHSSWSSLAQWMVSLLAACSARLGAFFGLVLAVLRLWSLVFCYFRAACSRARKKPAAQHPSPKQIQGQKSALTSAAKFLHWPVSISHISTEVPALTFPNLLHPSSSALAPGRAAETASVTHATCEKGAQEPPKTGSANATTREMLWGLPWCSLSLFSIQGLPAFPSLTVGRFAKMCFHVLKGQRGPFPGVIHTQVHNLEFKTRGLYHTIQVPNAIHKPNQRDESWAPAPAPTHKCQRPWNNEGSQPTPPCAIVQSAVLENQRRSGTNDKTKTTSVKHVRAYMHACECANTKFQTIKVRMQQRCSWFPFAACCAGILFLCWGPAIPKYTPGWNTTFSLMEAGLTNLPFWLCPTSGAV